MDIGTVGAGLSGGALARRVRAADHQVSIANSRGPHSLADLARQLDVRAVTAEEAAQASDIVVVSPPPEGSAMNQTMKAWRFPVSEEAAPLLVT